MSGPLVLSLFPGIGIWDRALEAEGFCVVRGPDLLWGGDIARFHPPAGRFDGLVGGPPCIGESTLAHLNGNPGYTLRDEFLRVVAEAAPQWWVMEAVKRHADLACHTVALSPRWLGEVQSRRRYFHSNLDLAPYLDVALFEHPTFKHAVLAGHGGKVGQITQHMAKYCWTEACQLQRLPADFDLPGFTREAKYKALGNGVPMALGRAIARAVRRALNLDTLSKVAR